MTIFLAMLLDAIIGDPKWLWARVPHPVVLIGRVITAFEEAFNKGSSAKRAGLFLVVLLILSSIVLGLLPRLVSWGWVFEIGLGAILIAQRSLATHLQSVASGLETSIEKGRAEVAMIVGRDTAEMDTAQVTRAAIESAAENFSDGVAAPIFWFAIGGLPGILTYKAINTADSMIGYLNEKYRDFGWAAARFDDLLNWIPARLTGFVMAALTGNIFNWSDIATEARQHRSPNAGWPEAAAARALNVALSGPRSYEGKIEDHPFVFPAGRRDIGPADIRAVIRLTWQLWSVILICAAISAGAFMVFG
ncbi:MAG: adenosylcobinamide-phosphate synthase CbiB [Pseudomonadota bacterium]